MRSLIVEDEFTSRMQLKYFLERHGKVDIAVNGDEALQAYKLALLQNDPYNVICLDIRMPGQDGHEVLKEIRTLEESIDKANRAKVFMTSALADPKNVMQAYHNLCDEYLEKPVTKEKIDSTLTAHGLI